MRTGSLVEFVSVRLNEFLQRFAPALDPPRRGLLWELVAGVVASGSLRLSEIARTQITHSSRLRAMEEHLSVQLGSRHWDHGPLAEALLIDQAGEVGRDSVVAVDFTELVKPYARKLQYLDQVSDRSDPDKRIRPGYWVFAAYRVTPGDQVAPLYVRLFSNRQPRFPGQNKLFDDEVFHLRQTLQGRGIWVLDRGFDGGDNLRSLLRYEQPRWVVRQRGDRNLIDAAGQTRSVRGWAEHIRQHLPEHRVAGARRVFLPSDRRGLELVTGRWCFPDDPEPWMLLTGGFDHPPYTPRKALSAYVRRWRGEDGIRFVKQRLGWETFMVQYFRAMDRLILIGQLAFAFLAELVAEDRPQVADLEEAALHFDEPIQLRVYRVARGVQRLTAGQPFRVMRA
jgi:hypothetical protein